MTDDRPNRVAIYVIGGVAILGLVAAFAQAFVRLPAPPNLSEEIGILREHKERGESHARNIPREYEQEGRKRYVNLMSRFNGILASLENTVQNGTPLPAQLAEDLQRAVQASHDFDYRCRHPGIDFLGGPPVNRDAPRDSRLANFVGAFKDLVEWSRGMREKKKQATIKPLVDQLRALRWAPPEAVLEKGF